jgi:hypothetical protein
MFTGWSVELRAGRGNTRRGLTWWEHDAVRRRSQVFDQVLEEVGYRRTHLDIWSRSRHDVYPLGRLACPRVHESAGNGSACPGRGGHEHGEHGHVRCRAGLASGPCGVQRGVTGIPQGAAYGASEVASLLTEVWVPTGGRKEGGRRVVSMANHWAMVAVQGRKVSRRGRKGKTEGREG